MKNRGQEKERRFYYVGEGVGAPNPGETTEELEKRMENSSLKRSILSDEPIPKNRITGRPIGKTTT